MTNEYTMREILLDDPTRHDKTVVRRLGDMWCVFEPLYMSADGPARQGYPFRTFEAALCFAVGYSAARFR